MTQLQYDFDNVVLFPGKSKETGRSLLTQAINAYQNELSRITDCAAPNTWMVYPETGKQAGKSILRTQLEDGRVAEKVMRPGQAAAWEASRLRRERKQSLTVLIDTLVNALARGL